VYSLLELFLRQNHKVIFIAAANTYPHYLSVMKKLGINLQQSITSGQLHYFDMDQAPFDYNTFDNLPLSLTAPNTFSQKMPPKLQKMSFKLIENTQSAQMSHLNFKTMFAKIDKQLKLMQKKTPGDSFLILIDNWNILANSCDSESPELDMLESFNELLAFA
jgi:archaellum biogenesis ATPase FlaH